MREFSFPSAGKGNIHGYVWEPEGMPVGVVQIVHGIAEHMLRYDDFARFLNGKGFVVAGEDHMGHGKSVAEGDTKCYFTGGWKAAVADCHTMQQTVAASYPGLPYFILGHSMGSFLTRTLLFTYPDSGLAGAMLSGTGWQPAPVLAAGKAICKREARRVGADGCSERIVKLMFGRYCKGIPDAKSVNAWICSVPEVVDAYDADPLCGADVTVGLAYDMLCGLQMIQNRENLAKMPKDLPVYFYAGDADPVGNMGKGVRRAYQAFKDAGMQDVSIKLYPGFRHEMHNEKNHEEVYDDVWHWLEKKL